MADDLTQMGQRAPTEIRRLRFDGFVWKEQDESGNTVRRYRSEVKFDVLDQNGEVMKAFRGADPTPHLSAAAKKAGKDFADALLDTARAKVLP